MTGDPNALALEVVEFLWRHEAYDLSRQSEGLNYQIGDEPPAKKALAGP
jgi:hypothetical protein